jgi:hypothetical protein
MQDIGFTDPNFFSAQPMLLLSQWQSCARAKLRENGLLVMLKLGEAKFSDLWNRIGAVGAVSSYCEHGPDDYDVAFQLQLNRVNPDGPSLKCSAGFSVSELLYQEVSGLDFIDIQENRSEIPYILSDYSLIYLEFVSVKGRGIANELQKMYEESRKTKFCMDTLQLWVMHERILLCCQSNDNRARWLNILGDICLQSYQASVTLDDLNQAVCAYSDAVWDDPRPVTYLADLGNSLQHHFKWHGTLLDINRSLVMLTAAVALTPDGHPDKPSWLSNLGISLSRCFVWNDVVLGWHLVGFCKDNHPYSTTCLSSVNSLFSLWTTRV